MAKHKLLLADDSVTIQKVVNLTFADEGIEVTAVGDGDAAMQKFVESVPDLVMVDVNMPGVDGYRICEMIKQDEETRHIPVILLVGSFEPFNEEEARRVGADDFLTKPFQSIRQLVNKVSDLLNGKTSGTFGDEAAVVNSFDDTLEMPAPLKETTAAIEDFGDAAMDDEMIQTSQIGSLPVNEAQKFESPAPENQTSDDEDLSFGTEDFDENLTKTSAERTPPEENLPEDEFTPAENSAEIADDAVDDDEPVPRHENIYEFASDQESADEKDSVQPDETSRIKAERHLTEESETVEDEKEFTPENEAAEAVGEPVKPQQNDKIEPSATFETMPGFELDDFDLLELPQSKKFKSAKPPPFFEKSEVERQMPSGSLSPEEIEAIADKVVEKLSDKVIKRIVREVFSQMTKKK